MEMSKVKPRTDLGAVLYSSWLKVPQLINSSVGENPLPRIFCAIKAIEIREVGKEARVIFLS